MPHDHRLRIYLQYKSLFLSDLRFALTQLERAYNLLQARELNRRRVPLSERLIVEGVETGQSIELILAGGTGLWLLWRVAEKVFGTRKVAWESEKAKWDAKLAQLEYERRTEEIRETERRSLPPETQAEELVAGLVDTLALRGEIKSIQMEIDKKILQLGPSKGEDRAEDEGR